LSKVNTLEKELGEDAAEIIKEPKYFVDFMRDAPEPTGEEVRPGANVIKKNFRDLRVFVIG
jgi:hypothetical protein